MQTPGGAWEYYEKLPGAIYDVAPRRPEEFSPTMVITKSGASFRLSTACATFSESD
jgi:hypothetical protein